MHHKCCQKYLRLTEELGSKTSIVCVTKHADFTAMEALAKLNIPLIFGENKWQVAQDKLQFLKHYNNIEWHFIGHLQSNKAAKVVENFDVIQSLDSMSLALKVNKAAEKLGKIQRVYLQINFSQESQKFGVDIIKKDELLKEVCQLNHLKIEGIMCMAAKQNVTHNLTQTFQSAKQWFDSIQKNHPNIIQLSMGMSQDYQNAIKNGSTMIRLGSYFFD